MSTCFIVRIDCQQIRLLLRRRPRNVNVGRCGGWPQIHVVFISVCLYINKRQTYTVAHIVLASRLR